MSDVEEAVVEVNVSELEVKMDAQEQGHIDAACLDLNDATISVLLNDNGDEEDVKQRENDMINKKIKVGGIQKGWKLDASTKIKNIPGLAINDDVGRQIVEQIGNYYNVRRNQTSQRDFGIGWYNKLFDAKYALPTVYYYKDIDPENYDWDLHDSHHTPAKILSGDLVVSLEQDEMSPEDMEGACAEFGKYKFVKTIGGKWQQHNVKHVKGTYYEVNEKPQDKYEFNALFTTKVAWKCIWRSHLDHSDFIYITPGAMLSLNSNLSEEMIESGQGLFLVVFDVNEDSFDAHVNDRRHLAKNGKEGPWWIASFRKQQIRFFNYFGRNNNQMLFCRMACLNVNYKGMKVDKEQILALDVMQGVWKGVKRLFLIAKSIGLNEEYYDQQDCFKFVVWDLYAKAKSSYDTQSRMKEFAEYCESVRITGATMPDPKDWDLAWEELILTCHEIYSMNLVFVFRYLLESQRKSNATRRNASNTRPTRSKGALYRSSPHDQPKLDGAGLLVHGAPIIDYVKHKKSILKYRRESMFM